jgi:hypothetical protein
LVFKETIWQRITIFKEDGFSSNHIEMMMLWYIFYRVMTVAGQAQENTGIDGCKIANNFQLSYGSNNWWTCSHHVAECFDQVTMLLKNHLTDGKCRQNACYVKDNVSALETNTEQFPFYYNREFYGYNGQCRVPFFTVAMEKSANILLQKSQHCLFDIKEYEHLTALIMRSLRAERHCLVANKCRQLNSQYGGLQPRTVSQPSTASSSPYVSGNQCILPELVEKTLRMRIGQYTQFLSQQQSSTNNNYWLWHIQNSKSIIENFLTGNFCSKDPIYAA